MEVLMSRRTSRMLIGVLSVTTIVGLSAYAIAHRKAPVKGSTMLAATADASAAMPTTRPAKESPVAADDRPRQQTPPITPPPAPPKATLAMAVAKPSAMNAL